MLIVYFIIFFFFKCTLTSVWYSINLHTLTFHHKSPKDIKYLFFKTKNIANLIDKNVFINWIKNRFLLHTFYFHDPVFHLPPLPMNTPRPQRTGPGSASLLSWQPAFWWRHVGWTPVVWDGTQTLSLPLLIGHPPHIQLQTPAKNSSWRRKKDLIIKTNFRSINICWTLILLNFIDKSIYKIK